MTGDVKRAVADTLFEYSQNRKVVEELREQLEDMGQKLKSTGETLLDDPESYEPVDGLEYRSVNTDDGIALEGIEVVVNRYREALAKDAELSECLRNNGHGHMLA